MSKNPFRRPQQETHRPLNLSQDATDFPTVSENQPSSDSERRASKTKRVRIATPPPLSPDSVKSPSYDDDSPSQRVYDGPHPGSPPPESMSDSSDSTIEPVVDDPFNRSSEDEFSASEELAYNTRRNSETSSTSSRPVPPISNPFQKTLATMEATSTQTDDPTKLPESRPDAAEQRGQRQVLDVDSFKRLLMTGNAAPSPSGGSPASTYNSNNAGSYFNIDSSSTDTSSLSRHSIFESSLEPPEDTPRTSTEGTRSDEDGREPASAPKQPKKIKPPPPRHRHGKSVTQTSAQPPTSIPLSATEDSHSEANPKDIPLPLSGRKTGQPSKPLPPPPKVFNTSRPEAKSVSADQQDSSDATSQKQPISPPPGPLHRGSSYMDSNEYSVSSFPSMQTDPASPASPAAEAPKYSRAPPPPPTRRSGARSQVFTADPSSVHSASSSPSMRPVPATPIDVSAQPLSRSASNASRNQMPPPPPPARRRGSSKSSLEGPRIASSPSPRTSQDMSRTLPSPSPPGGSSGDSKDVLADLSALQAEVDALRAKYGKPS